MFMMPKDTISLLGSILCPFRDANDRPTAIDPYGWTTKKLCLYHWKDYINYIDTNMNMGCPTVSEIIAMVKPILIKWPTTLLSNVNWWNELGFKLPPPLIGPNTSTL